VVVNVLSVLIVDLLGHKPGAVVEQVGIGIVSFDEENFEMYLRSLADAQLDNHVDESADVGFDARRGGHPPTLQNNTGELASPCCADFCMNRGKAFRSPGVSGVAGDRRLRARISPITMRSGGGGGGAVFKRSRIATTAGRPFLFAAGFKKTVTRLFCGSRISSLRCLHARTRSSC